MPNSSFSTNTQIETIAVNKAETVLETSGIPAKSEGATHGLVIPDTTEFTADKTIATTDQIPDVSGKLDKVTTGGSYDQVYGKSYTGSQIMINLTETVMEADTIPRRGTGGQITVPTTPTANGHAASKNYVDTQVETAIPLVGSSAITGNLIPSADKGISIGDASHRTYYNYMYRILGVQSIGNSNDVSTNQLTLPSRSGTIATTDQIPTSVGGMSGGVITSATTTNDGGYIRSGTTTNTGSGAHYLSAGGGYSKNSGRYGVKVVCCDQSDCQSGLGQDLNPNVSDGYDMCIVGSHSPSTGKGHISFVSHEASSNTYRELGRIDDNNGTVINIMKGTISDGTNSCSISDLIAVVNALKNKKDKVLTTDNINIDSNGILNIDI